MDRWEKYWLDIRGIARAVTHRYSPQSRNLAPIELVRPTDGEDFMIVVTLSRDELDQAIADWAKACTQFPER